MSTPNTTPPTFYPYFGYKDAAAALDWLERAFGFETLYAARTDRAKSCTRVVARHMKAVGRSRFVQTARS